ncbi:DUF4438 domain-containing protein [Chloroflexota bacterium]
MTVKMNTDRLVSVSVMGQIVSPHFPTLPALPYSLSAAGEPFLLPPYGGIVYNVSVGDSAYGWLADCVHPSVSIAVANERGNLGLNILACVGNEAMVMTGGAQKVKGIVTGKSGRFSEHVIIHFAPEDRDKMAIGDKIVVRSKGVGLELDGHPDIKVKSCAPELLEALEVATRDDGKLGVPVTAVVPSHLLGAGVGLTSEGGSLHIQTADTEALHAAGLGELRLGDVVALTDYDSSWSHGYLRNAVGIGVVAQGDSPRTGYGPGVTLLMTSASGDIAPTVADGGVNLVELLGL